MVMAHSTTSPHVALFLRSCCLHIAFMFRGGLAVYRVVPPTGQGNFMYRSSQNVPRVSVEYLLSLFVHVLHIHAWIPVRSGRILP